MNKERIYERFIELKRASERLNEATKIHLVHDIVYDGVIQRFEFTFELCWKTIKLFLEFKGISEIRSPRDAIREAFAYGLIDDGERWIDMLTDRNKTSHIYDEADARLIYERIKTSYSPDLQALVDRLDVAIQEFK
ncbi:nucleotidyltransferase substrate binding protein (TIGR01987 family) [Pullulanibacillus pueri]|uniref:Nucleotidyltransferase n=1 Tax=Pullulanibacillus pueri TaxID=1437324 RepID=A0A8J3EKU8_9BACL|nr:nucleotidyltransferase substrate binding protein [Pullulanibacillus pueri]MBM7680267.1 nucleotidyltransferase substrate binding protein (TIGR01987 family) [Pullulanibacillus pueri]GGH75938.1 nucleotidyltransferase [Pullulanibacillus pueri]